MIAYLKIVQLEIISMRQFLQKYNIGNQIHFSFSEKGVGIMGYQQDKKLINLIGRNIFCNENNSLGSKFGDELISKIREVIKEIDTEYEIIRYPKII
jgi:hypothetical protein